MDESNAANLVKELREKVLSAVEMIIPDEYHPDDVERFKSNDKWVSRFLGHHEGDMNLAQDMVLESFKWRKKFGVHDISEETLPKSLLKMGAIYEYTHDKEGHKILMLHIKMHQKDSEMPNKRKLLVYWIEKMEQSLDGEKITVFFDMSDSGISNMDLDLVKFLISLFKYYYPYLLAYILVYEMPWIMNAAWKMVKTWLSAKAVDKIKFINKTTVQEYIDADQLPIHMGGTNTFIYAYKPDNGSDSTSSDSEQISTSSTPKKKVHFAMDPVKQDVLSGGDVKDNYIQDNNRLNRHNLATYYNGRFLRISPAEELVFSADSQGDNTGTLNLFNDTDKSVAFKVKTTTPEKFRVRPSSGMVTPMNHTDILVQLQPGYQNSSLVRDKFLVMAMQVEDNEVTNQEVTDLWRNCPRENIMEHKLRCSLIISSISKESIEVHQQTATCRNDICQHAMLEIKSLQNTIIKMRHEIYALFIVLVLVMLITLILIVIIWRNFDLTSSNEYAANSCVGIHPP